MNWWSWALLGTLVAVSYSRPEVALDSGLWVGVPVVWLDLCMGRAHPRP